MAIEVTQEKRRLIVQLGENEAPTNFQWEVMTFVREGGVDVTQPSKNFIEADAASAQAFLDAALVAQRDAVAGLSGQRAVLIQSLEQQVATLTDTLAAMTQERDAAVAQYQQLLSEVEPA